ncbi:vitelline membrane outer layer protein 1 homolog [Sinocyclocheilus grahami]|uniref:vitelline membrane outer layer protein 1 homolog n=1 Tax=Sinocyclocheilus grahami TaxID=75366 RepID=UPI0007AD4DDA|nr:PREDICTED: vitelline membrane outer layer protein 1 homolog [Sinocyclocheilus grahami]
MHHLIFTGFSLLIFTGLHVSVRSTGRRLERSSERHFTSLLTVSNGMRWGSWGRSEFCPNGTYAKGFNVKCHIYSRFNCSGVYEMVGEGAAWGEWGEWSPTCQGRGICGIRTRIEEPQGFGDDTALNDVIMYCCD